VVQSRVSQSEAEVRKHAGWSSGWRAVCAADKFGVREMRDMHFVGHRRLSREPLLLYACSIPLDDRHGLALFCGTSLPPLDLHTTTLPDMHHHKDGVAMDRSPRHSKHAHAHAAVNPAPARGRRL
jgi:hypothetical protein